MARTVTVSIVLRARDLASKVIGGARRSFTGLRSQIFSLNTLFTALATGAIARGVKALFDLGAASEETASKFATVFGESTASVQEFNDTFGALAGLSREQAQTLTSTTGAIVQGMGFAQQSSADFATSIVELGADLASFHNAPTAQTIDAINSALTGITVPLKQFGIILRQDDVVQRALINTGKASAAQLTEQERATSALQLITEKAGVAVGDLERTQNSMQNTARRAAGSLKTLQELMGSTFLDTIRLSGGIGGAGDKLAQLTRVVQENRGTIAAWGAFVVKTVGFVISVFKNLVRVAFNVGQVIGDALIFIFDTLVDRIQVVGTLMVGLLTRDVGLLKKGIRGAFDLSDVRVALVEFAEKMRVNLSDIGGAANEVSQALADMAIAAQRAAQASRGEIDISVPTVGPPGVVTPEGADELTKRREAAEQEAESLGKQAQQLAQRFDLGLVTFDEYTAALEPLVIRMRELAALGLLNEESAIKLQQAYEGLREHAVGLAKELQPTEVVTPQQLGLLDQFANSLKDMFGDAEQFGEVMARSADQFLNDFGGAIEEAFGLWISGAEGAATAFKNGMLKAIGAVAAAEGRYFLGKSLGALAEGLLGLRPNAFAAAAKFAAAAAAMFAISGSLGGLAGGFGGGGRGGSVREIDDRTGMVERGDITVVIRGGLLDMSDPRQAEAFAAALGDVTGRRVIITQ